MKKLIFTLLLFFMSLSCVNAEATRKEYYDKTTDIKFLAPLSLEYTKKEEYPTDIVDGAYYEAVFYNDASRFMIYTVRHCVSDKNFDSKAFSSVSKEQMGKGVAGNEYFTKYGYLDASKEEVVGIVATYDENFYYYMAFIFPKLDEYYKSLVETIAASTTFGYKKDVTTCEGNTGKENFENNSSSSGSTTNTPEDDKQSTEDKYYHPEDEEEKVEQEEQPVLDYEKEAREKKELEKRNMLLKGVISAVFLLAFVYLLGCNKFEFSVFGMFLMIAQLAFIFLLDLNLIEGHKINYLYTILYVIPGIISILLLTRKQTKKEVEN